LATLAANPFDDAKPEFFARFEAMIEWATGSEVRIVRPFEMLSKRCVMQLGRDVPLELTFSCIAPVGGLHCGHCNKCAERAAAFRHLSAGDPTEYAQEVA
jgi:7-cyano-7-deazaguanine synthase